MNNSQHFLLKPSSLITSSTKLLQKYKGFQWLLKAKPSLSLVNWRAGPAPRSVSPPVKKSSFLPLLRSHIQTNKQDQYFSLPYISRQQLSFALLHYKLYRKLHHTHIASQQVRVSCSDLGVPPSPTHLPSSWLGKKSLSEYQYPGQVGNTPKTASIIPQEPNSQKMVPQETFAMRNHNVTSTNLPSPKSQAVILPSEKISRCTAYELLTPQKHKYCLLSPY